MTDEEETSGRPDPGSGHPPPAVNGEPGPAAGTESGTAGDTAATAVTKRGKAGARRRSFWRELPVLIVVALVIALVIKQFVVQAFYIPSGSMQDTLDIGDKVLVSKVVYRLRPIRAGDIIVFDGAGSWNAPSAPPTRSNPVARLYDATLRPLFHSIGGLFGTAPGQTDYIKRVIGVPGDHVACCNRQGLVTVNGVALRERSYLFPGNAPAASPPGEPRHFSITVPPGRLWVLGDHRAISDDSRGHEVDPGNGTIPESEVIGRAFMIVWPPSRWRVLPIPATFGQPGVATPPAQAGLRSAILGPAPDGRLVPAAPYLPLGAGLAGAIPVTYLRRRSRMRSPRQRRDETP